MNESKTNSHNDNDVHFAGTKYHHISNFNNQMVKCNDVKEAILTGWSLLFFY